MSTPDTTTADSVTPTSPKYGGKRRKRKRWTPGLSGRVLIGLFLGVAAGVVFGEWAAHLKIIGDVFIGLLQMTVLPYIVVSLLVSLGRLSYQEVWLLVRKGGIFVLVFWGIAIVVILGMTIALPDWPSATFFSTSLIEKREPLDLVQLYIPANPFSSLANGIVPAIVIMSIAGGMALIGVPDKQYLLKNLEMASDAIMRIATFVVQLAPLGVFALVAATAGTISFEDLGRLQVYILSYIGAALLLSLFILPGIVSIMTPIPFRRVWSGTQDALITAFVTGNLLIVLPLLSQQIKDMLDEYGCLDQDSEGAADLMVPINFNLPNLGKLLSLAFIPFAGWFAGTPLSPEDYPQLIGVGLFSFFGEVVFALPFLLDLMRIPADTFQIFIAVDQFTGRFGTLLAGMHTVVLALLTAVAVTGKLKLRWPKVIRHFVISALLLLGLFGGLRLFFEDVVPQEYHAYHALNEIDLLSKRPDVNLLQLRSVEPLPYSERDDRMKAIKARGRLRVGYVSDSLPFAYERQDGDLVGLEVDIIQMMANDMGVGLALVEVKRDELAKLLSNGQIDIAIGGMFATPDRALKFQLSEPYMDASLSLVVRDHRRREFDDWEQVQEMEDLKLALLDIPFYVKRAKSAFPDAEVKVVKSPRVFLGAQKGEYDAMLYSAEAGSAWTLLYPGFSVVVPNPNVISVPIVFGLPADAATLANYVNAWVSLNKSGSLVDRLYSYWILGKGARERKSRWSVVHNVLGWGQN